ncbi:ATP-binding cassette domain-containing protein [Iamia sp. SCSIO 61187]|uniref:ATP-binding cassette domain-containing protein n=1 Tax=Iamia sp. SCSIO 61187 TaxID=2722752 RepID=UPI001C636AE0|nr:ATP-binding cassette domain-containing protein [Iamia sp. SCSIO 61187]QYG94105.1 ATP-binding cassette domain-containing protein [Iamia sp. SCSIO 61187]
MTPTHAPLIEARGLTTRFGAVTALDHLDLVAEPGRVVALLGPNGAGKTTFVRHVATLARPDAGTLHVAGIDALAHPARVRRCIGLAGQSASVEPAMTGRENLRMVGHLFGLDRGEAARRADAVLDELALTEAGGRLVRTYSGGMRRRLDLGASLVGRPRLLLLDEPTTGLDPRSRSELWAAIRTLVAGGTDVLLTTQYLEEADQLARDVVILDHGRVVASGTPDDLKRRAGADVVEVRPHDPADIPRVLDLLGRVGESEARADDDGTRAAVNAGRGADDLTEAVLALAHEGITVDDVGLRRPTLDEVFLALTGHTSTTPDLIEEPTP